MQFGCSFGSEPLIHVPAAQVTFRGEVTGTSSDASSSAASSKAALEDVRLFLQAELPALFSSGVSFQTLINMFAKHSGILAMLMVHVVCMACAGDTHLSLQSELPRLAKHLSQQPASICGQPLQIFPGHCCSCNQMSFFGGVEAFARGMSVSLGCWLPKQAVAIEQLQ